MTRAWLFLTAAAALHALSACTTSSVVMLPGDRGGHGQVTIAKRGAPTASAVVTQPGTRATLGAGAPVVRALGAKGLNAADAALLAGLPPPPRSFTFYFFEGTTRMTPESLPLVEALRAEIARRPGPEVQVTGHTDTVGSSADNDALSRRRAQEILRLLVDQGFDRRIMKAVGRGERELAQRTGDEVSSAVNRRVEVIVR